MPVNHDPLPLEPIKGMGPPKAPETQKETQMSSPLSRLATRVAYGARQLPRMAWYVGHSLAVRRLSEEVRRQEDQKSRPRALTHAPVPDRRRLYADMARLLQQDLANVEAGIYPLPADHDGFH